MIEMTREDTLALIAVEGCAKLSEAISRAMRFGYVNSDGNGPLNIDVLTSQYHQLIAVMEMMEKQGMVLDLSPCEIASIKKKKIEFCDNQIAYNIRKSEH